MTIRNTNVLCFREHINNTTPIPASTRRCFIMLIDTKIHDDKKTPSTHRINSIKSAVKEQLTKIISHPQSADRIEIHASGDKKSKQVVSADIEVTSLCNLHHQIDHLAFQESEGCDLKACRSKLLIIVERFPSYLCESFLFSDALNGAGMTSTLERLETPSISAHETNPWIPFGAHQNPSDAQNTHLARGLSRDDSECRASSQNNKSDFRHRQKMDISPTIDCGANTDELERSKCLAADGDPGSLHVRRSFHFPKMENPNGIAKSSHTRVTASDARPQNRAKSYRTSSSHASCKYSRTIEFRPGRFSSL